VAAEIIKTIRVQYPSASDAELRRKVGDNLRVCFLKDKVGKTWKDGVTMGLHSKHFIVDDICSYVGSQNLYICDLAEWGVVIDDEEEVKKMMVDYWNKIWKYSYTGEDCDVQAVMDGLEINRDAKSESAAALDNFKSRTNKMKTAAMAVAAMQHPGRGLNKEDSKWMYLNEDEPKNDAK